MFTGKKVLIFDLGGVLIDLHVERSFAALLEMGADAPLLTERNCLMNVNMMKYDRGDISTSGMFEYIASQLPEGVRNELRENLSTRLHEVWNLMLGEYAPYKFRRIQQLRSQGYRVVMLSNTNEGHWPEIERRFLETMGEPLQNFFDALYLSYRMGLRKPEPEIFRQVLAAEGAAPDDCLFFDDSAENCEAARAVGIDAYLMERNAPWSDEIMND
ncbi:MAG: HAD family phosphatase [Bacteroidaceae bacterium]|nr:HAD family phosphatase [Bacteroidaceae bacterium]